MVGKILWTWRVTSGARGKLSEFVGTCISTSTSTSCSVELGGKSLTCRSMIASVATLWSLGLQWSRWNVTNCAYGTPTIHAASGKLWMMASSLTCPDDCTRPSLWMIVLRTCSSESAILGDGTDDSISPAWSTCSWLLAWSIAAGRSVDDLAGADVEVGALLGTTIKESPSCMWWIGSNVNGIRSHPCLLEHLCRLHSWRYSANRMIWWPLVTSDNDTATAYAPFVQGHPCGKWKQAQHAWEHRYPGQW